MPTTVLPLHPAQQDVYMDQLLHPESPCYNIGCYLILTGPLDKERFTAAIRTLPEVFDAFRMRFDMDDTLPVVYFEDTCPVLHVTPVDFSGQDRETAIAWMKEQMGQPFRISKDQLLTEQYLLTISEEEHWYFPKYHHLLTDGYGVAATTRYIAARYKDDTASFCFPAYQDEIQHARAYYESEAYAREGAYWQQKLRERAFPLLERKPMLSSDKKAATLVKDMSPAETAMLEKLQQHTGASLQQLTMAALMIWFNRTTTQHEFVFGTPLHKRKKKKAASIPGMFTGILPFKGTIAKDMTVASLLKDIAATRRQDFRHQHYQLGDLNRHLKNNNGDTPLMQIIVNQLNADFNIDAGEQLHGATYDLPSGEISYPLEMVWRDYGRQQALQLRVDFQPQYMDEAEATLLLKRLFFIMGQFSGRLHDSIESIAVIPGEEDALLKSFNPPLTPAAPQQTILDLFRTQVLLTPDAPAVQFENITLTYKALDRRSGQLAHYLRNSGVDASGMVPLLIERSAEMIVCILGVLKTGAAYVPVDPAWPQSRIGYLLQDTTASLLLTNTAYDHNDVQVVRLAAVWPQITMLPEIPPAATLRPQDTAYVIYTSGSTGTPKGVMVQHKGLLASTMSRCSYYGNTGVMLLIPSFSFDSSVAVIFGTLCSGGTLLIARDEQLKDAAVVKQLLQSTESILCVPSYYRFLLDEHLLNKTALKRVILAGEALDAKLVARHHDQLPAVAMYNEYGPTECTVWATVAPVHPGDPLVTIGKPVDTVQVYILDQHKNRVPVGVTGEIYLGGPQIAGGYLSQPELAAEKFTTDFVTHTPGERLYRTGDTGRWLPDGNIAYTGRTDDQVKIRGYRIELGEIEQVLQQCEGVTQAVVIARADDGPHKKLVAYLVVTSIFSREAVRARLKEKLPEYMAPAHLMILPAIPLTANGKVDKQALPAPGNNESEHTAYVAPATPEALLLAGIWQELLHALRVGIYDNFFELGGDSIIAMQVVSRVKRVGYELQVKDIFARQTIDRLSLLIGTRQHTTGHAEQGALSGAAALLPIQQWYFSTNGNAATHFNQYVLLDVNREIPAAAIAEAITQLTHYHDALRFAYTRQDNGWIQTYGHASAAWQVVEMKTGTAEEVDAVVQQYQQGLHITAGKLVQAVLMIMPGTAASKLLLVVHHLAVDGVSWRIITDDLVTLLATRKPLEARKSASYRQWGEALANYARSARAARQLPYWEHSTASQQPLRTDKPYIGPVTAADTGVYKTQLSAALTQQLLKDASKAYHTEINDILLCAFARVLAAWNGAPRVMIGLEGHGREDIAPGIDLHRTVGWFTTQYPLLLELPAEGIGAQLKEVKEQLHQVPDKGIGYGALKYMATHPALQGEEPWEVTFNYLGQADNTSHAWVALQSLHASSGNERIVPGKLSVDAVVHDGALQIQWSFSRHHFEDTSIQQLAADFLQELTAITTHCVQQQPATTPADFGLQGIVSNTAWDAFLDTRREQVEGIYPLTGLQEGMLFHGLYDEHSPAYIEQLSFEMTAVNEDTFIRCWEVLMQRHSIFRSSFYHQQFDIPVQCVYKEALLPVTRLDYREMDAAAQQSALTAFLEEDRRRGFDFTTPPLMRICLIRLGEHHYRFQWTYHHMLMDGWSLPVLLEELVRLYEELSAGRPAPAYTADHFSDYIRFLGQRDKDTEAAWWKHTLRDMTTGTSLPFVKTATAGQQPVYRETLLQLDAPVAAAVMHYVQQHRITLNTLMQGVWAYLLYRYTGSNNIVFGITVAGRPDELPAIEQRIGLYINTLPLAAAIEEEEELTAWLQRIGDMQLQSREHQYAALSEIQREAGITGELFDTLLVFENYPFSDVLRSEEWKLQFSHLDVLEQTNYPLTLRIMTNNGISIGFIANETALGVHSAEMIAGHFEQLLQQIAGGNVARLKDLELLTAAEREQLLITFNDTQADYPQDATILSLFHEQVLRNPDAVAVVFEDSHLTYSMLDERAGRIAQCLRNNGVENEMMVPVCLDRSLHLMPAILGILKAGAAYVPLDMQYPDERISRMLHPCNAPVILTTGNYRERIHGIMPQRNIICVEEVAATQAVVEATVTPGSLAYVMYTSGSTGQPKGVAVTHQNVISLVINPGYVTHTETDAILSAGSLSFDATTFEYWGALLNGGRLVLSADSNLLDTQLLKDTLQRHQVTKMFFTASWFSQLIDTDITVFEPLTAVLTGGEKLSEKHAGIFRKTYPHISLTNAYGPTENTTFSLSYHITGETQTGSTPIGRPLNNRTAYILDDAGRPAPVGVAGELYVGGAGVARGYIHQDILNEEKFIPHPFAAEARLYKTGDRACWTHEGNVLYLGRTDDQVKIRGHRIEPGEVEQALIADEHVVNAAVVAGVQPNGDKYLIGYIVPGEAFDKEALLVYLRKQLPDYMVPSLIIPVSHIPLTANGKADRKALPAPDASLLPAQAYMPPRDAVEGSLTAIWQDLLQTDRIGIHDDFFESGGHSLLAMRLQSLLRSRMQVEVPVRTVFSHRTIARLAPVVKAARRRHALPPVTPHRLTSAVPLSFGQERLNFIDGLEGSIQYHIPSVVRLHGELNASALTQALQTVINRHEVLRTVICSNAGRAWQQVIDAGNWQLPVTDGQAWLQDKTALDAFIMSLIAAPFDLSADYMLRAHLIRLAANEHMLVIIVHHIASDGWSAGLMMKEIAIAYKAFAAGETPALPALDIQYADYAIWQREHISGDLLNGQLDYWKQQLEEVLPLPLMTDRPRPAIRTSNGAIGSFHIESTVIQALQELSRQQGTTLFMTMLAAYNALLYRYTGQDDICVGTPVSGRTQQEMEALMGFFVNTLALRSDLSNDPSFLHLLQQVKDTCLTAFEHQDAPFEKVVEVVVKERDLSRTPLFQVMFMVRNSQDVAQLELDGITARNEEVAFTTAQFELMLVLDETTNGFTGSIEYNTDLFDAATIDRFAAHFIQLLRGIAASPASPVSRFNILTPAEEQQLTIGFNNTAHPYAHTHSIVSLFDEQVKAAPDAVALVFEDTTLTYNELNARTNQLAHYLEQLGVTAESPVAVCMDRSADMMIGILAILKAGGAYVPVDPNYPAQRVTYMLEDLNSSWVLTSSNYRERLYGINTQAQLICLDDLPAAVAMLPSVPLTQQPAPAQMAYIIYTSGSTGNPKGVQVTHGNVVSLVNGVTYLDLTSNDTILSTGSPSFDAVTYEYWAALLNGGRLVFCTERTLMNSDLLKAAISKYQANKIFFTTSWFNHLVDIDITVFEEIQVVLTGGEKISEAHCERLMKTYPGISVINAYGPTENTTFSFTCEISDAAFPHPVPVGRPMSNRMGYILDNNRKPVPVGVAGEIYTGGAGVARGYFNRPELTAERFMDDPFTPLPGARMYKTGDLGRWLPDGNIEYLGRKDDQVKIRGYRIELGEIENALQQQEGIRQAVVIVRGVQRDQQLIAYITVTENYDRTAALTQLRSRLPEYMVPALLIEMENMPLTSNGKLNKRALPDPDLSTLLTEQYVAPRNPAEETMARIWQDLLKVQQVGIYDNFFELGGHSLLVTRLTSAIRHDLHAEVTIREVFAHPTVEKLAAFLVYQQPDTSMPEITRVNDAPERLPLSYPQERLWFLDRMQGSLSYHSPFGLRLKGKISKAALESALRMVLDRHEVLRTIYRSDEGEPWQEVIPAGNWTLPETYDPAFADDRALHAYATTAIERPFDLERDYMLRAELLKVSEEEHVLLITLHHIAVDGWSVSVLVNELAVLYESCYSGVPHELSPLPLQYSDYTLWQRRHLQGEALNRQLAYWKRQLDDVAILQLPVDYPRPATQSLKGETFYYKMNVALLETLQQFSRHEGATLFMTLLAAFKVLLHRYTSQDDICVGSPIANRTRQEIEPLIGFFVNTLALRTDLSGNPDFRTLLAKVKATTLEGYTNQDAPFEKVVDAVANDRDVSRTPLFQVMFILQNLPDAVIPKLGKATVTDEHMPNNTSKFDLTVDTVVNEDGLLFRVEYCSDLFEMATMKRFMQSFEVLLESIATHADREISALPILPAEEEQLLLHGFNDTGVVYPAGKGVIDLFEERATAQPDAEAVVYGDARLTYAALNEQANRIAHYLREKGVDADTLVPVCLSRSTAMIAAILGILKAGGAYVPVDPAYPEARIRYILTDTAADVVLTDMQNRGLLADMEVKDVLPLDMEVSLRMLSSYPTHNPVRKSSPGKLTYLIYTSGSTGTPKGVQMTDHALYNLLLWQEGQYSSRERRHVLQFTSINFDVSFQEIFATLCFGGGLFLVEEQRRKDMKVLVDEMNEHHITCLFMPYVVLKNLAAYCFESNIYPKYLREFFTAGEQLKLSEDVEVFFNTTGAVLHNQYGPSESHVVSAYQVQVADYRQRVLPPIGKPVSNTQLYILGVNNSLSPVGVPGELFIGGEQVARGYHHLPELTAERFLPDFVSGKPGARLYKTGDICRWLPDGNIEYMGRRDHQVKIRGNRVETGEIESVLGQCDLVSQSVVVVKEDQYNNKRLVAYIVPAGKYNREGIAHYLQSKLPEYMVPSLFAELQELPLTNNGKVNKRALPDPDIAALSGKSYVAPRNLTEQQLVEIWENLLQVSHVGIHDNFFELGGHSLLAMRLQSAIRKQIQVEVAVKAIFAHVTVARLAAHIQQEGRGLMLPAITAAPRPEKVPLSYSQERMWFIHQMQGSRQYHMPMVLQLDGPLHHAHLENAISALMKRHEVLHSVIRMDDGYAHQVVLPGDNWRMNVIHTTDGVMPDLAPLVDPPFDLTKQPMLRADLIVLNETSHVLLMTMHHIASDGWSLSILFHELVALYEALAQGRNAQLPPLEIQYADYAIWQRKYLSDTGLSAQLEYWKNKLNGVGSLQLPADYPRPAVQSRNGTVLWFNFSKTLSDQLYALSQQQDTTLFMTMLTAFKVLLYRYSGQEDICVGTPISGRTRQEVEGLIGFFINTLALRSDLSGNPSFVSLLQQVKQTTLAAYEYQDAPFEKIVDAVVKDRDLSRSPLFQAMFVLQNTPPLPAMKMNDITITEHQAEHITSVLDLTFSFKESPEGLIGAIEYCTDLFSRETVLRMVSHYETLLESIIIDPLLPVGVLTMLKQAEVQQLIHGFNNTAAPYPADKTITDLFQAHVKSIPDAHAVLFEDTVLTYKQLDEKTNQLAHYLLEAGMEREMLVPVCMDRSAAMIIVILGIIKAGGAYVPMDPEYPAERISYMLSDSGAVMMMSSEKTMPALTPATAEVKVHLWEDIAAVTGKYPVTPPPVRLQPDQLIYVIYTSGSTGKPKGVLVEHRGLVNLVTCNIEVMNIRPGTRTLQFASFGFDASCYEIFNTLCAGAVLVIPKKEELLSSAGFSTMVNKRKVDLAIVPPSYLHGVLDMLGPVKTVVSCGEALNREDAKYLQGKGMRIINAYGPTEITICATITDSPVRGEEVVIGKPIANIQVYIIDRSGNLCPVGVPGEICISGAGLARGYLNRESLTAEKFIENPFTEDGSMLYRSGDLGRWRADGNIEYMGRIDDQVKVRGYRIELGEIEYELRACNMVSEAAVLVKGSAGDNRRLVAYIVPQGPFDKEAILAYLKGRLPHFMVPSMLVPMEKLPMTSNGKIDRKALPEPVVTSAAEQQGADDPCNEVEAKLAEIWKEVLHVPRLGIHDNFFETGGNSLIAIRLIARMQAHFQVTINNLFQHPTIAGISKHVIYEKDYFRNKLAALIQLYAGTNATEDAPTITGPHEEALAWQQEQYQHSIAQLDSIDVTAQLTYRKVLLLGATGYLGMQLLHDLLQRKDAVIAVLVRARSQEEAFRRLSQKYAFYFDTPLDKENPYLEVLNGDITQPWLGMDENRFSQWFEEVDSIVNSAANVKHFGSYETFEEVNTTSVKILLEYCRNSSNKVIHHISTTSVAGERPGDSNDLLYTEADVFKGQVVTNFYAKSKLEAERLLDEARAEGIPVNIYRLGNISFHSGTGRFQENIDNNAFYTQIKGFAAIGAAPQSNLPVDLSNVDQVSAAILKIFDKRQLLNRNYHILNPNRLTIQEFIAFMNSYGLETALLTVPQYLERLLDAYETRKDLVNRLLLQADFFNETAENTGAWQFCSDVTDAVLKKLKFKWNRMDEAKIHLMLEYASTVKFIEAGTVMSEL